VPRSTPRLRRPLAAAVASCVVASIVLVLGTVAGAATSDQLGKIAASGDLDKVIVTGTDGDKPTVTFEKPFAVTKSESKDLVKGTGPVVKKKDKVTFDFVVLNGRTGAELGTSYGQSHPAGAIVDKAHLAPGLLKGLVGATVGSRVLVALAPKEGVTVGLQSPGIDAKKSDTVLLLLDVRSIRDPLARATGTAVTPPAGLPTVVLNAATGKPTITVPPAGTVAPTSLVAQTLIQGTGPVVAAGDTLTVHYTGVVYSSGKQIESSWKDGSPIDITIGVGQVIKGWDQGLVGQNVGSQVLLVIPPDLAGGAGQSTGVSSGTETVVFVVDILDAY
jgi:peptidylprolyl isomerase